ncbi:MAG: tripartite tricarboxylate transporter TctB family protein [Spirochaetales bacterium]|nr:tripartite tricarboxylate transporter TctB family protein [Spirochaetales bacterium]
MDTIKYFGKGPGLYIMASVLFFLFAAIIFAIYKSSKKEYFWRLSIPVFFIMTVLGFMVIAMGLPVKGDEVGPAIVPELWITGIILLSVLIIIRTLFGLDEKDPGWGRVGVVGAFLAFTILYLYMIIYIGYYISTLIYLSVSIYSLSYRDIKVIAGLSLGWILVSYVAFYRILYVPLPKGILIERIFG